MTDRVFVNLISEVPWLVVVLSSIRHFSSFFAQIFSYIIMIFKVERIEGTGKSFLKNPIFQLILDNQKSDIGYIPDVSL